jgi:hypothetical protein
MSQQRERTCNNYRLPAFILPTGLPEFYLDRCLDFFQRQLPFSNSLIPTWSEIDKLMKITDCKNGPIQYYLDCVIICARFAKYSSLLSDGGKDWARKVGMALQQEMAHRVENDPFGFVEDENDHSCFSKHICQDHFNVYTRYFEHLQLPDLVKIPIIPFIKYFLDPNNLLTTFQVGLNTLPRIAGCLRNQHQVPINSNAQLNEPGELHDY